MIDRSAVVPGLPKSSYLSFDAYSLPDARSVYWNGAVTALDEAELLRRSAFMIPDDDPAPPRFGAAAQTFQAERYGGNSIGVHGGGVRCGNTGGLSVKGGGCNPLAGQGAPVDYSHGGMALAEGIQEALWGEVFHIALPYGAVRAAGVIATGSSCWWVERRWGRELLRDRYGDDVYIPRGLLVREQAIRPAHFERGLFYKPQDDAPWNTILDVNRVYAATRQLGEWLPQPKCADEVEQTRIASGLREMARRFARQSAAAKASRMVHGNICSSNICLDARWIDFGSVTAVPNFGSLGGYGDYWQDGQCYQDVFDLLASVVSKHAADLAGDAPSGEELGEIYHSALTEELDARLLGMAGGPIDLKLGREAESVSKDLLRAIKRVATAGHRLPFDGHPDAGASFGACRLNEILYGVLVGERSPLRNVPAPCHGIVTDLVEAYRSYLNVLRHTLGALLPPASGEILLELGVARLKGDVDELYKGNLVRLAEHTVSEHRQPEELGDATRKLFSRVLGEASYRYTPTRGLSAALGGAEGGMLFYDAKNDDIVRRDGSNGEARVPRCSEQGRTWGRALMPFANDVRQEALFGAGGNLPMTGG